MRAQAQIEPPLNNQVINVNRLNSGEDSVQILNNVSKVFNIILGYVVLVCCYVLASIKVFYLLARLEKFPVNNQIIEINQVLLRVEKVSIYFSC